MDWNNNRKVWSWSESNTGNLRAACFNIDRKDCATCDMLTDEPFDIFKVRFSPDFALWAPDIREVLLSVDLGQVCDGGGSEFPLSSNSSRMVSTKKLIPAN